MIGEQFWRLCFTIASACWRRRPELRRCQDQANVRAYVAWSDVWFLSRSCLRNKRTRFSPDTARSPHIISLPPSSIAGTTPAA